RAILLQSILPTTASRSGCTTRRPSPQIAHLSVRTSVGTAVPPGRRLISPIEKPPALVVDAVVAAGGLVLSPDVHAAATTASAAIAAGTTTSDRCAIFTSPLLRGSGDRS